MRFYNTMARKKEVFKPQKGKRVSMYVCGITPYDASHLGHARCYITWDVLRRYLEFSGYQVTFIQNITDIDDKIIRRAHEQHLDPKTLSKKFSDQFESELARLRIKPADQYPKVTENIPAIISMIQQIIQHGMAYEQDGDVYFEVKKFKAYGTLSRQNLNDLIQGKRVEHGEKKRHPEDFALWKQAKPGEPFWKSPWGNGRPGWHIECSAMSTKYLGNQFDIHAGGQDLIFPHHENEIAQSEAASQKKPFVRYWLHNGFVTVEKDKMAKSAGNFMTIHEALQIHSPQSIRYFILSTHYRHPLDYSEKALEQSKRSLESIYNAIDRLEKTMKKQTVNADSLNGPVEMRLQAFIHAMDDDLNTPLAIAALFQLRDYAFQQLEAFQKTKTSDTLLSLYEAHRTLVQLMDVLGLQQQTKTKASVSKEIKEQIEARERARKNKDFKKADAIRNELLQKGVVLEDTPEGIQWRSDS
ncbi:cysteine--tRNA ligase [Candidatus Micrarchaeota archaeon]|nr:cysteine--tRNA ligase [Candidatus Micrarchaeota archaeon]